MIRSLSSGSWETLIFGYQRVHMPNSVNGVVPTSQWPNTEYPRAWALGLRMLLYSCCTGFGIVLPGTRGSALWASGPEPEKKFPTLLLLHVVSNSNANPKCSLL